MSKVEEQMSAILKKLETGAKTADLARKHRISQARICIWNAKFGGTDLGGQAIKGGGGECEAEEASGREDAR